MAGLKWPDTSSYQNDKTIATIDDISGNQATVSMAHGVLQNLSGRNFQNYTASFGTLTSNGTTYYAYTIKRDGNDLGPTYAAEYMKYMTGSSFVPTFSSDFPKQSYLLFLDTDTNIGSPLTIWKPQLSIIDAQGSYRMYLFYSGMLVDSDHVQTINAKKKFNNGIDIGNAHLNYDGTDGCLKITF